MPGGGSDLPKAPPGSSSWFPSSRDTSWFPGRPYSDTVLGKVSMRLALADRELDLDGDGIKETFVIPVSVKAQSGDVANKLILATLADMSVAIKSVKFDGTLLNISEDGSYTGHITPGSSYAKLVIQATLNGIPEVRDLEGTVVVENTHNLPAVSTDRLDVSEVTAANPMITYNLVVKTAVDRKSVV